MGLIVNLFLRLTILYFLGEVMLFPDDPRFAGKAIPIRNLIIVLSLSLLFPLLYFLKKRWPFGKAQAFDSEAQARRGYPFWFDNLYLSIFWLDMAGNSFNLYDTHFYFDLIPHFHGTGAIVAVFQGALGFSTPISLVLGNGIHILLEAQEYYTDVFFGTHNVRGAFDTQNDVIFGILGSLAYSFVLFWRKKKSK